MAMRRNYNIFMSILDSLVYIFLNYFVCNIPMWSIRKILYRVCGLKIGKNSRILMKTTIVCPWKIEIGENTYVNEYCFLDGRGRIKIGSNVTVAIYSKLITGYHDIHDSTFSYQKRPIEINDYCVIFASCIVLGGVIMQNGALFTAGTVAKAGIYFPNAVYAGNPALCIGKRKAEKYDLKKWYLFFR